MKRLAKKDIQMTLPAHLPIQRAYRRSSVQAVLIDSKNNEFDSACVNCYDSPCLSFSSAEIFREGTVSSPVDPQTNVCPFAAISCTDGRIQIDELRCVGCAVCVPRCPVGAIYWKSGSVDVRIVSEGTDYRSFLGNEADFHHHVSTIQELVQAASPKFNHSRYLATVKALLVASASRSGSDLVRKYVRSVSLLRGSPARLKITGDSSSWAELALFKDDQIFPTELESGGDCLDAARRLLNGCARLIHRYKATREMITPVLVVANMPNLRSDYYQIVSDVEFELGIKIRTVPIAIIALEAFDNSFDWREFATRHCSITPNNATENSMIRQIQAMYKLENLIDLGVVPEK
jgi:Fe-S-cluster-containing hydrogenase component 2